MDISPDVCQRRIDEYQKVADQWETTGDNYSRSARRLEAEANATADGRTKTQLRARAASAQQQAELCYEHRRTYLKLVEQQRHLLAYAPGGPGREERR
jgi:hypothetical protein